MMYIRLLVLVAIFRFHSSLHVAPALLFLSALAAGYAVWIRKDRRSLPPAPPAEAVPQDAPGEGSDHATEPALRKNPLEINSALLFAFMFVVISLATKYVLINFKGLGLQMLSFLVGCSDITPFVVSVLQGDLGIGSTQILQAIVIASASNNLLKMAYTYLFGTRRTANLAAVGMGSLALLSILYVLFLL